MRPSFRFVFCTACLLLMVTATLIAHALQTAPPGVEVLSFKIGSDYYPMLDRKPSSISADNGEMPMTEAERAARTSATATRRNNSNSSSATSEEKRSRGRLRSTIQVIDTAEWVNLTVRNTSSKTIKSIDWDFAFPRRADGQILLRYDVSSKVEIKTAGKKILKERLPVGAMRCKVVTVSNDKAFEAVCGQGINDPSQFPQQPVSIKRIEYADGSVWQRP